MSYATEYAVPYHSKHYQPDRTFLFIGLIHLGTALALSLLLFA